MKSLKLGILRETKSPPDKRVPLGPRQCAEVMKRWPHVTVVVQPSGIRKFKDEDYSSAGIQLQEDLNDCDILMGVKEVKIPTLIPNKTYFFFSHTFKQQPYNAGLLKALLDKKIALVDYEVIIGTNGHRLIGFGRYAGIVGCYNAFRAYGEKSKRYSLKPAHKCADRKDMEAQLSHVDLPSDFKMVLSGFGRVGHGAYEILGLLPIKEVESPPFLIESYDTPVFTRLDVDEYNERISDQGFDKGEFYADPSGYRSTFPKYAHVADVYIACHYWADGAPFIFTREDVKSPKWKVNVVADISCDIDGPVASTIRPSTIEDPLYGYHKFTEKETDIDDEDTICVMAVDNLPCELPKDSSEDFGSELIDKVFPHLFGGDPDGIIMNASETNLEGELTENFGYLADYAAQGTY